MKNFKMNVLPIIVVIFLGILEYTNGLFGPNVCTKQQNYTLTTRVKYQQPVSVKTYSWCFDIPPKCSSVHTEIRNMWETLTEQRTTTVELCCGGFKPFESRCIPKCNEGLTGEKCDEDCSSNKWGPSCSKECRCPKNSNCDSKNGKCICIDGWVGASCNLERNSYTKIPLTPFNRETKSLFDWSSPTQVPILVTTLKHDLITSSTQQSIEKNTAIPPSTIPMYINRHTETTTEVTEIPTTIITSTQEITTSSMQKSIVLAEDIHKNANNTTISPIRQTVTESVLSAITTTPVIPDSDLNSQIESPKVTETTHVTDSPITLIKTKTQPTESSIISLTVLKSTASTARRKQQLPANSTLANVKATPRSKVYTESRMITIPVKIVFDSGYQHIYKKNYTKYIGNVSRISVSENGRSYKKMHQHDGTLLPFNVTLPSLVTKDIQTEETKHVLTEPEQITSVAGSEDSEDGRDELYSTLSIAMGVATAIILMAAIIVLVARYRRGRSQRSKNMERDHVQAMMNGTEDEIPSTYLRSVFHSPLPDPPGTTLQYPNTATGKTLHVPFMQPVVIHAVSPMMMENFRDIIECHYDHPKPPRPTSFSPALRNSTFGVVSSSGNRMSTLPKPRDALKNTDVSFPVTDAAINTLKLECQNKHTVEMENLDPVYDEIPWSTSMMNSDNMGMIGDEAVTEL